jgi:hypothetical protein
MSETKTHDKPRSTREQEDFLFQREWEIIKEHYDETDTTLAHDVYVAVTIAATVLEDGRVRDVQHSVFRSTYPGITKFLVEMHNVLLHLFNAHNRVTRGWMTVRKFVDVLLGMGKVHEAEAGVAGAHVIRGVFDKREVPPT